MKLKLIFCDSFENTFKENIFTENTRSKTQSKTNKVVGQNPMEKLHFYLNPTRNVRQLPSFGKNTLKELQDSYNMKGGLGQDAKMTPMGL